MSDLIKQETPDKVADDDLTGASIDDLDHLAMVAEAAEAQRKRFGIVFDATGSMHAYWREAQAALKQAVEEIKQRTHVPFQVKVTGYRDHVDDPPAMVTEESEWSDDPTYLKDFIGSVRCGGGGDTPESIGHGLRPYVQSRTSSIILVGDAWGKSGSTGFEEARIFGTDNTPIYALYTDIHDSRTREHFQELARLSGGKALHLSSKEAIHEIMLIILAKGTGLMLEYQPKTLAAKQLLEGLK